MKNKSVIYIAGTDHTGSTMLDIILGNSHDTFSAGELVYFPGKGIMNKEYCSCGCTVPECPFWSVIIKKWNVKRKLTLKEYINTQNKLLSKKNIYSSFIALKKNSGNVKLYIEDTRSLFNVIFEHTNRSCIIDSSKSPIRILILKKLGFEVTVVHLMRRFGDFLNSNKKSLKKDLQAGIEHDIFPKKTSYVISIWLVTHILIFLFSKKLNYKKIKYENYVTDPVYSIVQIKGIDENFKKLLINRGPFLSEHLVAGNRIRLQKSLLLAKKPMNTSYNRLNSSDTYLARIVDYFY